MKNCSACGVEKSEQEFGRDKATKSGLKSRCKPCEKAYQSAYYSKNRDIAIARSKKWRAENVTPSDNPHGKKYWTDEERAEANREKSRRWRLNNLESARLAGRNKEARRHATKKTFVESDPRLKFAWQVVSGFYGEMCMKCSSSENLHLDHIVALANGGPHSFDNFQILCISCNSSKRNYTSDDYRPVIMTDDDVNELVALW